MSKKITDEVCLKVFSHAEALWDKNETIAFELLLLLASIGYEDAYNNLGVMYDTGFGVEKNQDKALFWYKKSWRKDRLTDSCLNISSVYFERENYRRGLFWLNKAVKSGDYEAKLELVKYKLSRQKYNRAELINLLDEIICAKVQRGISFDSLEEAKQIKLKLEQD